MTEREAPRYIVAQKIPTPIRSMMVAKRVAKGIRVTHDLQQPKIVLNFNLWSLLGPFCLGVKERFMMILIELNSHHN